MPSAATTCWRLTLIPSPCLANALGLPLEMADEIVPISEMEELIYERTGAKPGTTGGYFRLNPRVDDIPERFSATYKGIRLLQLGHVEKGGSGCICPESTLLKALVTHLLLARRDVVILDMYAGTEHLGRGTAESVDAFLIVVEPSARSLATAMQMEQAGARYPHRASVRAGQSGAQRGRQAVHRGQRPQAAAAGRAARGSAPCWRLIAWACRSIEHAPALLAEAERVIAELDKLAAA